MLSVKQGNLKGGCFKLRILKMQRTGYIRPPFNSELYLQYPFPNRQGHSLYLNVHFPELPLKERYRTPLDNNSPNSNHGGLRVSGFLIMLVTQNHLNNLGLQNLSERTGGHSR